MPKAPHHLAVPAAAEPHPEHLLLALIRQQRTPANVAAVARLFGVTRPTIRRWRDRLRDAGLIGEDAAGYWTINAATFARWQAEQVQLIAAAGRSWRAGVLPVALLRIGRGRNHKPMPPTQLLAAAQLVAEAMRDRAGTPADAEVAHRAGVAIGTVRKAKQALRARKLVKLVNERHGRARVVRVVPTRDCWATQLAGDRRLEPLAEHHLRGARGGGKRLAPPHEPRRENPDRKPLKQQVGQTQKQTQHRHDHGDRIGQLLDAVAGRRSIVAAAAPPPSLTALLDPANVQRLLRMPPSRAVEQALLAAGCWTRAHRRREQAVGLLIRRHGARAVALLLGVVADAAADRVRNVAAVTSWRFQKLLGAAPQLALTRQNASLGDILDAGRQAVAS